MKHLIQFGLSICLMISFISQAQTSIDSTLIKELSEMAKVDQLAAINSRPPNSHSHLSQEQWESFKDSIYRANQQRAEQILDTRGYPGYDVLGKEASYLFWVIVQHSDHNPEFQKRVLLLMQQEVERQNANPRDFALLTDRVCVNTGQKQVYGTQVSYNLLSGKASPEPTIDPEHLNERRSQVGLEPIETYLSEMTASHMEHNSVLGGVTNIALIILLGVIVFATSLSLVVRVIRKRYVS